MNLKFGYFSDFIFNKPSLIYYLISYLILFLVLLFIQYNNYQNDFYDIKSTQKRISFPKISVIVIFNLIYCFFLFNCAKIPIEYYLVSNPQSKIIISMDVKVNNRIVNRSYNTRIERYKTGYLFFYLYDKIEILNIRSKSEREFILKNKKKMRLKIYILKGHFDTYILQRYELLD